MQIIGAVIIAFTVGWGSSTLAQSMRKPTHGPRWL